MPKLNYLFLNYLIQGLPDKKRGYKSSWGKLWFLYKKKKRIVDIILFCAIFFFFFVVFLQVTKGCIRRYVQSHIGRFRF